jgi:thiamine biosynthesis lipoprotein
VPADLDQQIAAALEDINKQMSTYRNDSLLMEFNRAPLGEPFAISKDLLNVLVLAQSIHKSSEGAFDPTVGPLVNLWGFGPDYHEDQVPDSALIAEMVAKLGFDGIAIDASKVEATRLKKVALDLSAIAKGYAADKVAEVLRGHGLSRYMVEVGGEMALAGTNARNTPWQIAIEKPVAGVRDVQQIVSFTNVGVATSGDYRNYFEKDGVRYSHTLDPRTGYPINHKLASVTVAAESSALADGLATAFMVMGTEKALAFAEKYSIAIMTLSKTDSGFEAEYSSAFLPYLEEAN